MWQNNFYYGTTRVAFSAGNLMQIYVFFLSGFTMFKKFFSAPFFLVAGKLCYLTALITPIMIQLIYTT